MHVLDLPSLARRPEPEVLIDALTNLEQKNLFIPGKSVEDKVQPDSRGLFAWLTQLVGSPLEWVTDEHLKEEIWNLTSLRMAERCGRTAAPSRVRELELSNNVTVNLIEPSLTSDSLGLTTWGSSMILAERLIKQHEKILVDPVLELGSGTGLCGIVASKLGHDICMTDLPQIIENLQRNVDKNSINLDNSKVKPLVAVLDWTEPQRFEYKDRRFNSIVVSDPIYSDEHPKMVCNVIDKFLDKNSTSQLCVQLPLRAKFDRERQMFYDNLQQIGLTRIDYEEESGYDDFGQQDYAWSLWKWSDTN